jgi:hypothetical protein
MIFSTDAVAASLGLRIAPRLFQRHQRVGLFLPGICSDYVPKAIEAFNASDFEGMILRRCLLNKMDNPSSKVLKSKAQLG